MGPALQVTNEILTLRGVYHPLSPPPSVSQPATAPIGTTRLTSTQAHADAVSIPSLWHETLAIFSARCIPMLCVGLIGFAGAPMLVAAMTMGLSIAGMLGDGAASGTYDRPTNAMIAVQAVIYLIACAATRGAITWLAMHDGATLRDACRATCKRLPALVLVSLIYATWMTAGATGLDVWLRNWHIDSDRLVNPPMVTDERVQRVVFAQAADALIPDPIAPHTDVFPRLRTLSFDSTVTENLLRRLRSNALKHTVKSDMFLTYATTTPEFMLVPLAGLILILLGETLLRLRLVAVMRSESSDVLMAMTASLRFGIGHFGVITAHAWALRLMTAAISVAGVIVPNVLIQSLIVPQLVRALSTPVIYPISLFVCSTGAALVSAFFLAFSAVYDARLAMRLDPRMHSSTYLSASQ